MVARVGLCFFDCDCLEGFVVTKASAQDGVLGSMLISKYFSNRNLSIAATE